MAQVSYRRRARLAGIYSLADLLAGAWRTRGISSSQPTSTRLRRDVGLPVLEEERTVRTALDRKL